jgi:thermitase
MRRLRSLSAALVLVATLAACHQASPLAPAAERRTDDWAGVRSVPGRMLVQWKDADRAAQAKARLGLKTTGQIDGLETDVIDLPSGMSPEAFTAAMGDDAAFAEPDYLVRTFVAPNDEHYARQYALKKVGAEAAWGLERGDAEVRIAIVDTGADTQHPDLRGQVAGTFYGVGWRGAVGFGSARDDNGHGTHCAGVAAAIMGNQEGIAGMAPGCRLLIAKALGRDGVGSTSDLARGVNWAVSQGADVISMSVGSEDDSRPLRTAIQRAIAQGVVVVAAMGNEGKTLKNYPAAYPGVIAVGATDNEDRVTSFSTRGSWISVSAPGANILSTTPTYKVYMSEDANGGLEATYDRLTGTSMATPLVAGLAGLLKSKHPNWTPAQVKRQLEQTATAAGRKNTTLGYGRVNAAAALR